MADEAGTLGTPDAVRRAVRAYLMETHAQVVPLYRLEQQQRFDPDGAAPRSHRDFAADRLAAGALMLRDLWWSAWVDSARPVIDDVR